MGNKIVKSVLISGGWGYGNLGDDVILLSLIKSLQKKYPDANFTVFSYNVLETKSLLEGLNVIVIPSIHREFGGRIADFYFGYKFDWFFLIEKIPFFRRYFKRIKNFIYNYWLGKFKLKLSSSKLDGFYIDVFSKNDLFILGGGQYLNDWEDSLYSHIFEINIAHRFKMKVVGLGLTIGAFRFKNLENDFLNIVPKFDFLLLRDKKSKKLVEFLGTEVEYSSDLAFLCKQSSLNNGDFISIVLSYDMSLSLIKELISTIVSLSKKSSFQFLVFPTRLWKKDIDTCMDFYKSLIDQGIKVSLIIPSDLSKLENLISNSKLCVSFNLHALILSVRSSVPIVCLNRSRKFLSFLEQFNLVKFLYNGSNLELLIFSALSESLENREDKLDEIKKDLEYYIFNSF